jgi:hypothetical protein
LFRPPPVFPPGFACVATGSVAALAQTQAESLSASFRKALERAGSAVVAVRPVGVMAPNIPVPLPNVGSFRPGELLPRRAL